MALIGRIVPLLAALAAAVMIAALTLTTPGVVAGRGWIGLAAVEAMLAAYALIFLLPGRQIQPPGLELGLLAGGVYASEILLEYALTPRDNTPFGLIEFGAVFALFLITGLIAAARTGTLRPAIRAALGCAMLSAVIWYAVLLAVFLAFRGSDRQHLVLLAEGDFEDFKRSGETDFARFVVQDFIGAGFYHLMLAPIVAAILGSIGAGLGLLWRRTVRRRPA